MIIPTLRVAEREVYEEMLPAWKQHGVKCMRVNMTRYGMERYVEDVRYIREQMGEDFGVMADLPIPGRKYRLLFEGIMEVKKGERLVFIPEKAEERVDAVRVEIPEFSENAEKTRIIIGDGELSLQPEEITRFQITAIAENDAVIRGRKSFALLGVFPYALYEEEVLEEANLVLEKIAPYQLDCPVVFDVEKVSGAGRMNALSVEERTALTELFCQTVQNAGYRPMIYYNTEMAALMLNLTELEEYDKWYASYSEQMFFPYEYKIWQYSDKGKVQGISGDVDMNISFAPLWE